MTSKTTADTVQHASDELMTALCHIGTAMDAIGSMIPDEGTSLVSDREAWGWMSEASQLLLKVQHDLQERADAAHTTAGNPADA